MQITVTDLFDGVTPETSPVTITVVEGTASGGGGGAVDSVNGHTGVVVLDADDIPDGTTNHAFTAADDTKLAGIATGATANSSDAQLRDRSTHTGTQAISTVTGLQAALDAKAATTVTDALDTRLDTLEAVDYATQAELDTHAADTTSVHGITNTANLETTSGAQTKADAAQTAAEATAASALTTHAADTTSVHGIADTSALVTTSTVGELARDALGAALVGGTGITVTPNDGADTITVASTITQYTDEMARDALGTALTAGSNITITPNDGADTITIAASGGSSGPAHPDNLADFNTVYGTGITSYDEEFDAAGAPTSPPSPWAAIGAAGLTYVERFDAGIMSLTGTGGNNLRGISRTWPSESTWTAICKVSASMTGAGDQFFGFFLRQSSNGKLSGILRTTANGGEWLLIRYDSLTVWNGTQVSRTGVNFSSDLYLRIKKNSSTSYDFAVSADGLTWHTLASAHDPSGFLTPDHLCIIGNTNSGFAGDFAVHWFRVR